MPSWKILTNRRNREIFIDLLAGLVILSFLLWGQRQPPTKSTPLPLPTAIPSTPSTPTAPPAPILPETLANLRLTARAALGYDWNKKEVFFSKNPDLVVPIASLSKVMAAYAARDILGPDEVVIVPPELARDFASSSPFYTNEAWRLSDLITFTLITSSNEGMEVIDRAVGAKNDSNLVGRMNQLAADWELEQTSFLNPTGLDPAGSERGGGESTARAVAEMFGRIWQDRPEILRDTREPSLTITSESGYAHLAHNTNILTSRVPNILASKTGTTNLAGGALTMIIEVEKNRPLILVILGSTARARTSDMERLIRATIRHY